jgi:hypothetical protein
VVLALESARRGLRVARAGRWLAVVQDWSAIPVQRALMASLRWDDQFQNRELALMAVFHAADPETIITPLNAALVTDEELAAGRDERRRWPDPFTEMHRALFPARAHRDGRDG